MLCKIPLKDLNNEITYSKYLLNKMYLGGVWHTMSLTATKAEKSIFWVKVKVTSLEGHGFLKIYTGMHFISQWKLRKVDFNPL